MNNNHYYPIEWFKLKPTPHNSILHSYFPPTAPPGTSPNAFSSSTPSSPLNVVLPPTPSSYTSFLLSTSNNAAQNSATAAIPVLIKTSPLPPIALHMFSTSLSNRLIASATPLFSNGSVYGHSSTNSMHSESSASGPKTGRKNDQELLLLPLCFTVTYTNTNYSWCVLYPLVPNSYTVYDIIHHFPNRKPLLIQHRNSIALDIVYAVQYLQSLNLTHVINIKSTNIIVSSNGQAKLCDLKLFYSPEVEKIKKSVWRSPEMIYGQKTMQSDLWCWAVVVWEMVEMRMPYYWMFEEEESVGGRDNVWIEIEQYVLMGGKLKWKKEVGKRKKRMCERCWSGDVMKRIEWGEVRKEMEWIVKMEEEVESGGDLEGKKGDKIEGKREEGEEDEEDEGEDGEVGDKRRGKGKERLVEDEETDVIVGEFEGRLSSSV
eukprot:TRINITY_DN15113_c0_g1_i1.p1 TRINITY_DN15113_c0_g1~~TRINITY_DN15113_c0_g1_i1.p1  ORF type:complete len:430 (-),score=107.27 TRINITY_DN15113_c0_g1_i1:53-1342(-)